MKCTGALLLLLLASPALAEPAVVCSADNLVPKSWIDGGVVRGYAVDTAVLVLRAAGYGPVIPRALPWPQAQQEALAGHCFITHFSKTDARARVYDFSDMVVLDRIVAVVLRGSEFKFDSLTDLRGKRVGLLRAVQYGGNWSSAVPMFISVPDDGADQRLRALVQGQIDVAIISSGATGLAFAAAKAGLFPEQFTILQNPVEWDPNYIATAKGLLDAMAMAKINEAIAGLRADGTLARILKRYADMVPQ